jgi:hypothetical protein
MFGAVFRLKGYVYKDTRLLSWFSGKPKEFWKIDKNNTDSKHFEYITCKDICICYL